MTTMTPPSLSLAERDRRWARIRQFLAAEGLAGMIIPGLRSRETYETWVSGEAIQGAVVFPAEGDPVYLTWIAFRVIGRDDPQNDREYWIKDLRAGLIGPGVVSVLSELGLAGERIGVVGLRSRGPMELEGYIPYMLWAKVAEELPVPFSYLMAQKGQDELALARFAAEVGEHAC